MTREPPVVADSTFNEKILKTALQLLRDLNAIYVVIIDGKTYDDGMPLPGTKPATKRPYAKRVHGSILPFERDLLALEPGQSLVMEVPPGRSLLRFRACLNNWCVKHWGSYSCKTQLWEPTNQVKLTRLDPGARHPSPIPRVEGTAEAGTAPLA